MSYYFSHPAMGGHVEDKTEIPYHQYRNEGLWISLA